MKTFKERKIYVKETPMTGNIEKATNVTSENYKELFIYTFFESVSR